MHNKVLRDFEYIFETSWEVCNMVGGIYTVVSTKYLQAKQQTTGKYICLGPDLWRSKTPNPLFTEDDKLFFKWKKQLLNDKGIRVRCGHWNIPGNPVVILIDFTTLIEQKNHIFGELWSGFGLDSLFGSWEYIESALFGYAAGMVVESFSQFHLQEGSRVLAHFHEWMTGAGVLYLKHRVPYAFTVFTTHSTVTGRSVAGNHLPLYDQLHNYNGDHMAKELGVVAKHSLEQKSAMAADCFTTVSEITAIESKAIIGKNPDIVTPNGFETSFVPQGIEFSEKRSIARAKLKEVAEAVMGYQLTNDTLYIASSGRYEFRNKGIDVFIDALHKLNDNGSAKHPIVAFIMIPGNSFGPRKDILTDNKGEIFNDDFSNRFLTHGLHELHYDPILNTLKSCSLDNGTEDSVKLIFVPAYLNGNDGIFNMSYYDLLIGMDLTVFPSYYEPWGYTPMESVAFGVPTITTTLAGFGQWVFDKAGHVDQGITVLYRNDNNAGDVSDKIAAELALFTQLSPEQRENAASKAFDIASSVLWDNLYSYYIEAYKIALRYSKERFFKKEPTIKTNREMIALNNKSNTPTWKELKVMSNLPEELKGLGEIAHNIWYVWNYEAGELFGYMNPPLWNKYMNNAVRVLEQTPYERFTELMADHVFMSNFKKVYADFKAYMAVEPRKDTPSVSYFSMEYGLTDSIKVYSGGLGILAGDYLKEASDVNVNMTAVGLLYRYGYFTQVLSVHGDQQATYEPQNYSLLPLEQVKDAEGNALKFVLPFPGRDLHVAVWKIAVGRINLVLLDTDIEENADYDRSITYQLYGGDWENRLKQEVLLGIGGIQALRLMGIKTEMYHCNEGHAAFINVARLDEYINDGGMSFDEAFEMVRASSLFTTHTPVPAGHDSFEENMLRAYMRHVPERLHIDWNEFMGLGREEPGNGGEKFSMSNFAARTSQNMNGVSRLHGAVSRDMFQHLWKGFFPEELHIDYVTNGVHYGTWTATEWRKLYESNFGEGFLDDMSNTKYWEKIYELPDKLIWETKRKLKEKLMVYIRERFEADWLKLQGDPSRIVEILDLINPKVLTIGFARRFATYKRAHLLFNDLERLDRIVNNPNRPVQFLFAGKAHPADGGGQGLIKRVVEVSRMPQFLGKIIFLENYDMRLARRLVSGVDIWLNNPTRPLEASGTSGMKAELNGTLNLSVLDGWWCEGYIEGAGWALSEKRTFDNQDSQDELDAATIYSLLEHQITPAYYHQTEEGFSPDWVQLMKKSIAGIAPLFTTKRMIDDYIAKFYAPQAARVAKLSAKGYEKAVKIAEWKQKMASEWDKIQVLSVVDPSTAHSGLLTGMTYHVGLTLDLGQLSANDVSVELVQISTSEDNSNTIHKIVALTASKTEGSVVTFSAEKTYSDPGTFKFAMRMVPNHPDLPHRQDLAYIRWI